MAFSAAGLFAFGSSGVERLKRGKGGVRLG